MSEPFQLYYDIMMLRLRGNLNDEIIIEKLKVKQDSINKAEIWWVTNKTLTKVCTGEIKIDPENYKKFL